MNQFFRNAIHKLRYSDPPRLLFDLLSKLKIFIFPFNLYCVLIEDAISLPPRPAELADFQCRMLGREWQDTLASVPRAGDWTTKMRQRYDDGEICFGILKGDEIAGYAWFNRKECTSKLCPFTFEDDRQIYLFDVYVAPEYRGQGLAPFLVTQFYPWLQAENIEKVYATINLFNNPSKGLAIDYRQETPVKMLYVSLFNNFEHTFLLKSAKQ